MNSMSDLFHEDVPDEFIDKVFAVMAADIGHTFQILTKRQHRLAAYLITHDQTRHLVAAQKLVHEGKWPAGLKVRLAWPLPNVWLGISAEDQATADDRLPIGGDLGERGWTVMASLEPLLGSIILPSRYLALRSGAWIITGGESGPKARQSHPDWFRSLRDQCAAAGVPFFFKQWGAHVVGEMSHGEVSVKWQNGTTEYWGDHQDIKYANHWLSNNNGRLVVAYPCGKKKAGRLHDGREWNEYPK